jgi:murein DD-endopeptidase MepM/ murein hydrolase activator NlpD
MRCVIEPGRSLSVLRFAILATISVAAVSCSTDTSRFNNPFRSQAQAPTQESTGSVSPQKRSAIQSAPLPPPPGSAPASRPAVVGTAGGSAGMGSYQPAPVQRSVKGEVTGSVPAPATPQHVAAKSGWSWNGGTPIIVQKGDTIDGLVKRYGVPASAIAEANNIPNGTALKPGQHLVIPKYEATGSTQPRMAAPAPLAPVPQIAAPATAATTSHGQYVHVVAPGETLMALSRKYQKPLSVIARANKLAPSTMVKVGDRIIIPGVAAQAAAPQTLVKSPKTAEASKTAPEPKVASVPAVATPTPSAAMVTPAAHQPEPPKVKTDVTSAMPKFRWPVNGRVITAFGPRPSGAQNDGINLAVPENTPIKAADDGVVAYAGNELKTYGNLVLVRHPNGYVTAYAHASEILVKRDEPVKRGQIIAKAGQTGNVSSPQLHFEIRKGSTPVDPAPFLDKGGNG